MNRLRIRYRIGEFGDYGIIEKKIILLQCSYKYKIFWIERIGWNTIFEVLEEDLPSVNSNIKLINVMIDLWSKHRKDTLSSRLKSKVINNLNYA